MLRAAEPRVVNGRNAQRFKRRAHLRGRQRPDRVREDGKAAEQALPPEHGQHPVLAKHQHHAARFHALRFFLGLDGQALRHPLRVPLAARPHRAAQAGRAFRRAHRRAHLHHGIGERAGAVGRHETLRQLVNHAAALRAAHLLGNREIPADHALHVAIHRGGGDAERNGRNRAAGVIPDAGQGAQLLQIGGQLAAVLRNNLARRLLQQTRAAVIPQPLPRLEQFLLRRIGQRPHIGIARKKALIIRNDRLRARLLEHDFGNPDSISVLRAPPRQVAMPRVIPRKD